MTPAVPSSDPYVLPMTTSAEKLAELDALFFQSAGYWPERPGLDRVLVAKSRELAEVLLESDDL